VVLEEDKGEQGIITPRHILAGLQLALLQMDITLAHHVEQIDLGMHGKMHNPRASQILGQLLGEGREGVPLDIGIVSIASLERPGAIGLRLDSPHAVRIGHLRITLPGAVSKAIQKAAKMRLDEHTSLSRKQVECLLLLESS